MTEDSMFDGFGFGDNKASAVDVVKELLDPKNIVMKSDFNINQVKVMTQTYWFSLTLDRTMEDREIFELVNKTMRFYMKCMVSVGRKSREEVVKAVSEMREGLMDQQMLMNQFAKK